MCAGTPLSSSDGAVCASFVSLEPSAGDTNQNEVALVRRSHPETLQRWEREHKTQVSPPNPPFPLIDREGCQGKVTHSPGHLGQPKPGPWTLCVSGRPSAILLHKQALIHAEQNLRTPTRIPPLKTEAI